MTHNSKQPIYPVQVRNTLGQNIVLSGLTKFEYAVIHISATLINNPIMEDVTEHRKNMVSQSIKLAEEIFLQLEAYERQKGN